MRKGMKRVHQCSRHHFHRLPCCSSVLVQKDLACCEIVLLVLDSCRLRACVGQLLMRKECGSWQNAPGWHDAKLPSSGKGKQLGDGKSPNVTCKMYRRTLLHDTECTAWSGAQ